MTTDEDKPKRSYTDLSGLTAEQKLEHRRNQKRGYTKVKNPQTNLPTSQYRAKEDLSALSQEEKQLRHSKQKSESKARAMVAKIQTEDDEDYQSPPPELVHQGEDDDEYWRRQFEIITKSQKKIEQDEEANETKRANELQILVQSRERLAEERKAHIAESKAQLNKSEADHQKIQTFIFNNAAERKASTEARMNANNKLMDITMTLSSKKKKNPTNSESQRRMKDLIKTQQQPLADNFPDSLTSPTAADTATGLQVATSTTMDTDTTSSPALKPILSKSPKTPTPRGSKGLFSKIFGRSSRVSFGQSQVQEFETSPSERRNHPVQCFVPVTDEVKFDEWKVKSDESFVMDFTLETAEEMTQAVARQTLHLAERSDLFKSLDYDAVRAAAKKAFRLNRLEKKNKAKCLSRIQDLLRADREDQRNSDRLYEVPVTEAEKIAKGEVDKVLDLPSDESDVEA